MCGKKRYDWIYFEFTAWNLQRQKFSKNLKKTIGIPGLEKQLKIDLCRKNTAGNLFQYVHNLLVMHICQYPPITN